jgi:hypothetical protein
VRRFATVALLAVAVAAGGCGSGSKVDRKATHTARAEWGVALKQVAYLGTQEVKALRKLRPPDELASRFDALVNRLDAAYADLLRGADAAKRNDVPTLRRVVGAGRTKLAKVPALARDAGVPRCSS